MAAIRGRVGDGAVVLAGGATRMETFLRLFRASSAPLVLQHDVVHPFATPDLARQVVAAAERTGAAMAARLVAEHVFRGEVQVAERVAGGASRCDPICAGRPPCQPPTAASSPR